MILFKISVLELSYLWRLYWSLWLAHLKCSFKCDWFIYLPDYRLSNYMIGSQLVENLTFAPTLLPIDLFSLYVLFSHFRPRDATRGNSFFQMSSYARANVRITNEKNKRKIPMRASRGLKWENKMYKLKRSIDGNQHRSQTLSRKKPRERSWTATSEWYDQHRFAI